MEEVFDAEPRSEPWGEMDEDEVEQIADLRGRARSRGTDGRNYSCKGARGCAKPAAAEEDAHYDGTVSRAVRSPANTGQHVVSASHVEPHRHGTLCSCTARLQLSRHWQAPKVLHNASVRGCVPKHTCEESLARVLRPDTWFSRRGTDDHA